MKPRVIHCLSLNIDDAQSRKQQRRHKSRILVFTCHCEKESKKRTQIKGEIPKRAFWVFQTDRQRSSCFHSFFSSLSLSLSRVFSFPFGKAGKQKRDNVVSRSMCKSPLFRENRAAHSLGSARAALIGCLANLSPKRFKTPRRDTATMDLCS